MARPQKNNADYFPHDNNMWSDRKIVALRNRFGLIGYAVWNLLLETLCESENFEITFDESEAELLANFWGLEPEKLKEMLALMERLKLIERDGDLIWSNSLRERLKPVLDERARKRKWSRKRWQKDGSSEESDVENEVLDGNNPSDSEEAPASSIPKKRKEEEKKSKKSKKEKTLMSKEDFESFWKNYPKKQSKQKAQEKFLKLPREYLSKILQAVREQKKSLEWQKDGGQFVPHPTTWINAKRWEDDIRSYTFSHGKNQSNSGHSGHVSTEGHADLVV